jgi:P27 family predicted phage terminase small subunit
MSNPKKPALIRALEGNRGKRPMPTNELVGVGAPQPPAHLTEDQRARWQDVVASLPEGLLSRADEQVLERMAVAWAAFRQACMTITQAGLITRGANGEPVRNPLLIVRASAATEMNACGMLLGLSPLARVRLSSPERVDDDPLELLLGPQKKPWGHESIPVTRN